MRILVTGSSGQLARSLIERAEGRPNIELVAIGRPQLDLEVPGSASALVVKLAPDIVINAAAYTAVDLAEDEAERAFRINGSAAGEIAEAAASVGAAVIQISTDYVFDGQAREPYHEHSPVNPLGVYGRSKLAGEELVRAANPRHAVIRTAWVYGPFDRNFVKSIVAAVLRDEPLSVVDDQRGSPTSSLDLAEGLLTMIDSGNGWGDAYHLAGSDVMTWFELAEEIAAVCARLGRPQVLVRPITTQDWPTRAVRPRNSVLSSTKFEQTFGFVMPRGGASIAQTIERILRSQP